VAGLLGSDKGVMRYFGEDRGKRGGGIHNSPHASEKGAIVVLVYRGIQRSLVDYGKTGSTLANLIKWIAEDDEVRISIVNLESRIFRSNRRPRRTIHCSIPSHSIPGSRPTR
jgi:hypothetical protein